MYVKSLFAGAAPSAIGGGGVAGVAAETPAPPVEIGGAAAVGTEGLAANASSDQHAAQEDDHGDNGRRHEEKHELLAAQLNLVKPVVWRVV